MGGCNESSEVEGQSTGTTEEREKPAKTEKLLKIGQQV